MHTNTSSLNIEKIFYFFQLLTQLYPEDENWEPLDLFQRNTTHIFLHRFGSFQRLPKSEIFVSYIKSKLSFQIFI